MPILLAQKEFGSQATANTIWALAVLGCKDRNMTEPLQDAAIIASIVSFPILSFPSFSSLGFVLVFFWFVLFWFAYFVGDWFELLCFFLYWFEVFGSFPVRYVPLCLSVALLSCFGFALPCLLCLRACLRACCLFVVRLRFTGLGGHNYITLREVFPICLLATLFIFVFPGGHAMGIFVYPSFRTDQGVQWSAFGQCGLVFSFNVTQWTAADRSLA